MYGGTNSQRTIRTTSQVLYILALPRSALVYDTSVSHGEIVIAAGIFLSGKRDRFPSGPRRVECPLWVTSGHLQRIKRCPLCPRKPACVATRDVRYGPIADTTTREVPSSGPRTKRDPRSRSAGEHSAGRRSSAQGPRLRNRHTCRA